MKIDEKPASQFCRRCWSHEAVFLCGCSGLVFCFECSIRASEHEESAGEGRIFRTICPCCGSRLVPLENDQAS